MLAECTLKSQHANTDMALVLGHGMLWEDTAPLSTSLKNIILSVLSHVIVWPSLMSKPDLK